jgi:hypothetical protein
MKQLILNKVYSSVDNYEKLIDNSMKELEFDSSKNRHKILEICHVGKFLMFFENQFQIEKLSEEPDFIIANKNYRIGLEHQMIIDKKSKEKEGFFENLCKLAEKELRKDKNLPNFLANIYVHPYFNGKIKDKQKLINEICRLVKLQIQTDEIPGNDFIDNIITMKHSRISLCSNMGAWWQKEITEEFIIDAIKKKEKKIENYLTNIMAPQWLLIVIGGVGESSYRMGDNFNMTIETKFDKVFVLEDFYTKLFEIK